MMAIYLDELCEVLDCYFGRRSGVTASALIHGWKRNLTEVKLRSDIPVNAKFLGWVIWNPLQDDFLYQYKEDAYSLLKHWSAYPELAMRFKKHKHAVKLRNDLELRGKATIAAVFDCEYGIRIGN